MNRRTKRSDPPPAELLATLSDIRHKLIAIEARAIIGGPLYVECGKARAAIDGVVAVVTGDREALWNRPSSIGGSG